MEREGRREKGKILGDRRPVKVRMIFVGDLNRWMGRGSCTRSFSSMVGLSMCGL